MLPRITALDQVPLGPVIEQAVTRFDKEEPVRIELLRYAMSIGMEPLYPAECRKEFGWIKGWEDVRSATYIREKYMAAYVVLKYMHDRIRGEIPNIVSGDDETVADNMDLCRSEWLAHQEIRDALGQLLKALRTTLHWFNIKTLANWISGIYDYQLTAFPLTSKLSTCEISGKVYRIPEQCVMLDNFTYMRGREDASSLCARAYQQLMQALENSAPLKTLLFFDQQDLEVWVIARRTGELVECHDEQEVEEAEPEQDPEYTQTPGGIFVPKK